MDGNKKEMKIIFTILFLFALNVKGQSFFYNKTLAPITITLKGTWEDVKGKIYSGSVTLQPYSSIILIKDSISVLPVVFTSFTATAQGTTNVIAWSVGEESGINYYSIDRSQDAVNFASIGSRIVGAIYSFVDNLPAKIEYYRIQAYENGTPNQFTQTIQVINNNIVPIPPPKPPKKQCFLMNLFKKKN